MANFSKWNAKQDPRTELHDVLGLTGAEISINNLPAGVGVPFVHSHSPTTHGTPSTFVISYVDKVEWGGLAPFIQGAFTLTFGNIMIEINATEEAFCLSFQTVRKDRKYPDPPLITILIMSVIVHLNTVSQKRPSSRCFKEHMLINRSSHGIITLSSPQKIKFHDRCTRV